MEFTRSDSDGASQSRKRKRVDEVVTDGGRRRNVSPLRPLPTHSPLQLSSFNKGPPLNNNTFLDQPLRSPQMASTGYQDILRPTGTSSNHLQTGMYSPSPHDYIHRLQRPVALSKGSINGDNSPGNFAQSGAHPSKNGGLSHSDVSQEPGTDTFNNGSLVGDNAYLDRPLHEPQQTHALQSSLPQFGNNSPWDIPFYQDHEYKQQQDHQLKAYSPLHDTNQPNQQHPVLDPAPQRNMLQVRDRVSQDLKFDNLPLLGDNSQSFASGSPGDMWNMSMTPEDLPPRQNLPSPSQPLSSNYQFGHGNWAEFMGVEMEDATIRNNLEFADSPVIPDRLRFQGVKSLEEQAHVQGQLVQMAQQAVNSFQNNIPISNHLEHLMSSNGDPWQVLSPSSIHQEIQPQQTQSYQMQPQQMQPQQSQSHQIQPQQIESYQIQPWQIQAEEIQPEQIQPAQIEPEQVAAAATPQPAPNPTANQNQPIKMCKEPGCNQPRLFQTSRARKCQEHLENPLPESRLHALDQGATAGQDMCSGCNGLRPRRAPNKTCWECFCKGRRQRWGVCDGCPAFWCPKRVVEEA
ncbi:uncharacterized protein B0T23DRAFT_428190 [Neurospora hispaniola]|uniref:Uncharacterized protein n=1 Tax=Neurospora hispaniola TaxID=588809 RepID=A0AAJ0IB13_9PEZI|nr:hypothetical protein B0T23DRAFT_428190 [Neurospora hispaniola]